MTEEEMKWGEEYFWISRKKKPESQSRITLLGEGLQDKNAQTASQRPLTLTFPLPSPCKIIPNRVVSSVKAFMKSLSLWLFISLNSTTILTPSNPSGKRTSAQTIPCKMQILNYLFAPTPPQSLQLLLKA